MNCYLKSTYVSFQLCAGGHGQLVLGLEPKIKEVWKAEKTFEIAWKSDLRPDNDKFENCRRKKKSAPWFQAEIHPNLISKTPIAVR